MFSEEFFLFIIRLAAICIIIACFAQVKKIVCKKRRPLGGVTVHPAADSNRIGKDGFELRSLGAVLSDSLSHIVHNCPDCALLDGEPEHPGEHRIVRHVQRDQTSLLLVLRRRFRVAESTRG